MVGYAPFSYVDFDIKPTVVKPSTTVGYVRSVMSQSGLWQYAILICITDRPITDRLLVKAVGFLGFMY